MKFELDVRRWWLSAIHWPLTAGGRGTLVSLSIHLVLLILLAGWVIERLQPSGHLTTLVIDDEPGEIELGRVSVELFPDEATDETRPPQSVDVAAMLPKPELELPTPDWPDPQGKQGSGKGSGSMMGKGTGAGGRAPKNAVTKGSFTAWTVPEDPEPGQDYLIVIQVKLPEKVRQYPLRDLSGVVTGTDGWRQPLPGANQGMIRVVVQKARLEIRVPGAPRLIRDTVRVRSRILKEQQTLTIVF